MVSTGLAVGVDLVQVSRLSRLLLDNPAAEQEIFTGRELGYCTGKRNRIAHLAARFAAKEAVLKALGTGLGPGLRWTDVEVVNTPLGRPHVRLGGGAARRAAEAGASCVEISLSHSGEYAIAHAVMFLQTAAGADDAHTAAAMPAVTHEG
ncbi:holo-ACP synthase [Streptomyces sp. SYSU K217416]